MRFSAPRGATVLDLTKCAPPTQTPPSPHVHNNRTSHHHWQDNGWSCPQRPKTWPILPSTTVHHRIVTTLTKTTPLATGGAVLQGRERHRVQEDPDPAQRQGHQRLSRGQVLDTHTHTHARARAHAHTHRRVHIYTQTLYRLSCPPRPRTAPSSRRS